MEYEKVIDKIRKLKALAESGMEGEILAAKRAIESLCEKYGVDIESLCNEKVESRSFTLPYHDSSAREILFQVYSKVTNISQFSYSHNNNRNVIYLDLTNAQYIEVREMFDFYFTQWKKEKKALIENLQNAFINKHNLFSNEKDDSPQKKLSPEEWEKVLKAKILMDQLEDVSYLKRIE